MQTGSVVLTKVQVRCDARDRLQPSEIFMGLLAFTGQSLTEAIYGQDNHLGFGQAVRLAQLVDLIAGELGQPDVDLLGHAGTSSTERRTLRGELSGGPIEHRRTSLEGLLYVV